jgi:peptidoglycan/LPS O-acetylase OafA/YrhL
MSHLPELDSLRGLAIALVVLYHVDYLVEGTPKASQVSLPWAFIAAGHSGVTLFFVLSGFLLSRPFLADGGRQPVSLGDFFSHRCLRILPMYWLTVSVATVLSASSAAQLVRGIPYLVFLNGFGLHHPLFPYSAAWWSLATEVQFYLLLPLLAQCFRPGRRTIGWLCVVGLVGLYLSFVFRLFGSTSIVGQIVLATSIIGRGPVFLEGMAAAWLFQRLGPCAAGDGMWWGRMPLADGILLCLVILLALLLRWAAFQGFWAAESFQPWHIAEGAAWAGIMLLLVRHPLRCKALLVNPGTAELGMISYSLFLIHFPLLFFLLSGLLGTRVQGGWSKELCVVLLPVLAVCVGISSATYRLIERPFLKWRRTSM